MRFPATSFENLLRGKINSRLCEVQSTQTIIVSAHIAARSIMCRESVVQIRSVVMIALLAICRKIIISI
jgi:hypothetical protein